MDTAKTKQKKTEITLPDDKTIMHPSGTSHLDGKKKPTKCYTLSLAGLLHIATNMADHLLAAATKVKELDYSTWLNSEF